MKLKKINLIWVAPWPIGGFASFTGHLYACLKNQSIDVHVLRPNRDRSESTERLSKHNGFLYRNVTLREAIKATKEAPTIITSVAPEDAFADMRTLPKLMRAGAHVVIHGIQEFKQFPCVTKIANDEAARVLVIRRAMAKHMACKPGFLPHPYMPSQDIATTNSMAYWKRKPKTICTLGMIANLKHPEILCQYNQDRKTAAERIVLLGKETTHWLGLGLREKYSRYRKPKFDETATRSTLGLPFKFQADMSAWEGDGGGTQYSFLEAMDAGCVNILNDGWYVDHRYDEMVPQHNCEYVADADTLYERVQHLLKKPHRVADLLRGNLATLRDHSPAAIVKTLGRLL